MPHFGQATTVAEHGFQSHIVMGNRSSTPVSKYQRLAKVIFLRYRESTARERNLSYCIYINIWNRGRRVRLGQANV